MEHRKRKNEVLIGRYLCQDSVCVGTSGPFGIYNMKWIRCKKVWGMDERVYI
jgi:hypothetical protein